MSYKWPGIPNGDYSFDHGRAVWNKIINYLRRLCEKLDADIVDATADRRGMMTAADKQTLDAIPDIYAVRAGTLMDNPIIRTSPTDLVGGIRNGIGNDADEIIDVGWDVTEGSGAFLGLRSVNAVTDPGSFRLGAKNDQTYVVLRGWPDGRLTWNEHKVITITDTATSTTAGVMSAADKRALDAVPTIYETKANAITGLSVSGTTVTYTKGDGTTGTITTQDTDTTYNLATQSASGLMSSADKTYIDFLSGRIVNNNNLVRINSDITLNGLFKSSVQTESYMRVHVSALEDAASQWNELSFYGKEDGKRIGMLRATDYADGRHLVQLTASNTNPNDPDQTIWASVVLSAWPDGTVTVAAPTPAAANLNNTQIATTAFVKKCVPVSIGNATRPVYTDTNGVVTACAYELNKTVPADAVFTDTTYSLATQNTSGLMSADDKTIVDSVPNLGTFNKTFFSQTSGTFTAPRTGVYRITLKGGGGGGGARYTQYKTLGTGGGEGGTLVFYAALSKNTTYSYVVGAGGTGGIDGDEDTTYINGTAGGRTEFVIGNYTYYVTGGSAGANSGNLTKPAGLGGRKYAIGSRQGYFIPGAPGQSGGGIGSGTNVSFDFGYALCGGGNGGGNGDSNGAVLGGGGAGSSPAGNAPVAQDGGDGYVLIEYAG